MNRFVSRAARARLYGHTSFAEAIEGEEASIGPRFASCLGEFGLVMAIRIAVFAAILCAVPAAQTVGVIRSRPLPSPGQAASLESRVLENPEDLNARIQLLQLYLDTSSFPASTDPGRQSVRLQHILYLVELHPEAPASGTRIAYVYRANGPYANASDHDAVRAQWLAAVQSHSKNTAVVLNAVRFLEVEDAEDGERVLERAMEAEPENRELAANLGFLYAMELLGLDSMAPNRPPTVIGRDRPQRARAALEQCSNAVVLAAAGTAIPNLSRPFSVDSINQTMFDYASELSRRAKQLAPADPDIQGPLPLIQYFAAAQGSSGR